jgi:hypothetical protein
MDTKSDLVGRHASLIPTQMVINAYIIFNHRSLVSIV